ncbi:MAG: hypothetical protein R6V85_12855 [Polyangia bacterium]
MTEPTATTDIDEIISAALSRADAIASAISSRGEVSAIAGIPCTGETETLSSVVSAAGLGLEQRAAGPGTVICAGPPDSLRSAEQALTGGSAQLLDTGIEGRGQAAFVLMHVAASLGIPLVLLVPNLVPGDERSPWSGFSPSWIPRLLEPIGPGGYDLSLARFNRHPLANSVESLLAHPLLAQLFGVRIRQPMPGVAALSPRAIRSCLDAREKWFWPSETGNYGFDPWLTYHAAAEALEICQVPLGTAPFRHGAGRLKLVFRQATHAILARIAADPEKWHTRDLPVRAAAVLDADPRVAPAAFSISREQLLSRLRLEFDHFNETLFADVLPEDLFDKIAAATEGESIGAEDWCRALQRFLIAYRFESDFHPDDIADGLFPFFLGRLADVAGRHERTRDALSRATSLSKNERETLANLASERSIEDQTELFIAERRSFEESWKQREKESAPYLPRLGAWEFVPHVGVLVPQEIEGPNGESTWSHPVYKDLIDRYREEFTRFVVDELGLDGIRSSEEILSALHYFMRRLESGLDRVALPGDLSSLNDVRTLAEKICGTFAADEVFQLTPRAAAKIVERVPPRGLVTRLDLSGTAELLDLIDPSETLCMAAWTDRRTYLERVLDLLEKEGRPDWFERAPLLPAVLDLRLLTDAAEVRGTVSIARLAGRAMAVPHQPGWGGEFPKLRFVLQLAKRIAGIELFSEIWEGFASRADEFGARLTASIRGHWGRHVLSAHNVFENMQQRRVVERLRGFSQSLSTAGEDEREVAALIRAAANVYHLSITLPDNTFVPLSAWTWASYSARGGVGTPTPLSSLVERDWATADFLIALLERSGRGDASTVTREISSLIERGRESEDLGRILLGTPKTDDEVFVSRRRSGHPPPAAKLERVIDGPILEPIAEHDWESRYVLNAAAVRLGDRIQILYRAFGKDEVSRIGLAWTRDGSRIEGRLDAPIFSPADPSESSGCEDPRAVVIDDDLYMLYTAWDGELPQIAMASIPVEAFLEHRFDRWRRHGLAFPGLANKDAVLFPERFEDGWAVYHRIDPNLWISRLDDLGCPWPRTGQRILFGPRPGMMWDGVKLGAGAQPLKTTHGWLHIYHGVDFEKSYRLGVFFTSLDDPSEVLYRSPNAILEPEVDFEVGRVEGGDYWVPRVVFTCGAVPAEDKQVLGLDDYLLVYYGAADTAIGVARGRVRELVPILE